MAGNSNRNQQRDADNAKALTVVQPPRLPYPQEAAAELGVSAAGWKALTDAIFPSAKSVDGVMLAINYCKARNLDPFKRAVHVVPMYNSALGREVETVWPGINELRTTASRTGSYAGMDECRFGPTVKRPFEDSRTMTKRNSTETYVMREQCPAFDFPEWAQITVYRVVAGQRVPFVGPKVLFVEAFSGVKGLRVPNAKWQSSPFWMLEKNAEAAALRRAFPEEIGNELTAEEMEGKDFSGVTVDAKFVVVDDGNGAAAATADPKPTRDGQAKEDPGEAGWSDEIREDMEILQQRIDRNQDPDDLAEMRDHWLKTNEEINGWPKSAIDELRTRFNTRIKICNGEIVDDEDSSDGGDADAADGTDQPANEESK